MITLRPYRDRDAEVLVDLFRRAVREIACGDYTAEQIAAWAPDVIDVVAFARRRAVKLTWIAEVDGHVAGFSDLEPDGHIDMLYVDPLYQRRGVATRLLRHIEESARIRRLDRLHTEASVTARPIFERPGFSVLQPQQVRVTGDITPDHGETFLNYRMEKRLAY
jgi:putative acetyltransferase